MDTHVFAGSDRGRIKDALSQVLQTLQKQWGQDLEVFKVYIGEDELDNVLANLQNAGLFASYQTAILYNADGLSAKEAKLLESFFKANYDAVTLICIQDETKIDKLSFIPKNRIKTFYELSDAEKQSAIKSYFGTKSKVIDQDALLYFSDIVSPDTLDIRNQCDVLIASIQNKDTIGLNDIENLVYHSREEDVFSLTDYLFNQEFTQALASLQKIMSRSESEAVGLILGMQWQFRSLYELKFAGISSPSYDDFRQKRIFSKKAQAATVKALNLYSLNQLDHALSRINFYDQRVRESKTMTHSLLVEMLIYEIIHERTYPLYEKGYGIFEI